VTRSAVFQGGAVKINSEREVSIASIKRDRNESTSSSSQVNDRSVADAADLISKVINAKITPEHGGCSMEKRKENLGKKFNIRYEGDQNPIQKVDSTIVHSRKFGYQLEDYCSIVNVGVDFSAKCAFTLWNSDKCRQRILKVVDVHPETGKETVHGEMKINLLPGLPCVSAEANSITNYVEKREVRIAKETTL